MKHCLTLNDFSGAELLQIVQLALRIKREPHAYEGSLRGRWLLMLFQKLCYIHLQLLQKQFRRIHCLFLLQQMNEHQKLYLIFQHQ